MLTWHSSFAALTGYSGSSLAYVLGLDALGVPVRPLYLYGTDYDEQVQAGGMHPRIRELQAQPLRLDAPQVVYAPGDRFSKNSGRYRVGFTMLETDRLPASWVEQANQMDEVWTPSEWGAAVFRASGVTRPVYAVPLGVDTARFRPGPPRARLADRTVFLSVFEWGERKGWDVLLRAWRAAFAPGDPVLLILKVDCRMPVPNPLRELAAALPGPNCVIRWSVNAIPFWAGSTNGCATTAARKNSTVCWKYWPLPSRRTPVSLRSKPPSRRFMVACAIWKLRRIWMRPASIWKAGAGHGPSACWKNCGAARGIPPRPLSTCCWKPPD